MIQIIKEITLEVSKPNLFQAIVAKQYDMNTRFLKATLVDGKDIINIPASSTAKIVINAERRDGQSKSFDGVINEDGTVTVPLHSWMLELDGTVVCDVSVIDTATDDNKKLTTTSFNLLVEKAAYGGTDITSDPQYDILVQLIKKCQEIINGGGGSSGGGISEEVVDGKIATAFEEWGQQNQPETQLYKANDITEIDDVDGEYMYPNVNAVRNYVYAAIGEALEGSY